VFGLHRFEACKRLGFKKISAMVLNLSDAEAFLARIAENLLRNNEIDPIEEAKGYESLVQEGWTVHAIGERIGKSDSYVCRRLGILDGLDLGIAQAFSDKIYRHVSSSHMELISLIPEKSRQREFVNLVERKRLSVRSLENLLNHIPPPTNVLLEDLAGDCIVKIPPEFTKAIDLINGNYVRLYVRGRKLILENPRSNRRKDIG
jgi:ParB family chromosome partitioning protein